MFLSFTLLLLSVTAQIPDTYKSEFESIDVSEPFIDAHISASILISTKKGQQCLKEILEPASELDLDPANHLYFATQLLNCYTDSNISCPKGGDFHKCTKSSNTSTTQTQQDWGQAIEVLALYAKAPSDQDKIQSFHRFLNKVSQRIDSVLQFTCPLTDASSPLPPEALDLLMSPMGLFPQSDMGDTFDILMTFGYQLMEAWEEKKELGLDHLQLSDVSLGRASLSFAHDLATIMLSTIESGGAMMRDSIACLRLIAAHPQTHDSVSIPIDGDMFDSLLEMISGPMDEQKEFFKRLLAEIYEEQMELMDIIGE